MGPNMFRVCAATMACEVAYQAPDLVAAVALVQQHSVGIQNKVYTPNAQADRTMAGARSVAKLLGCHSSSFTGDDRRSDLEAAIAKMQAMLPAHRVEVADSRRAAGAALGLDWRVRAESTATVVSYRKDVSKSLFAVLQASEPGAAVPMTVTAALPFPTQVGVWLTVLHEFAHKLVCSRCMQELLFVPSPVLEEKVWEEHGLALPSAWLNPNELLSLKTVAGVLICKWCFQNQSSIEAVVTQTTLQVPRGTPREEAMKIWPSLSAEYNRPSFVNMMQSK